MASPLRLNQPSAREDAPAWLVVAWRNPETRGIQPVGLLSRDAGQYRFSYLDTSQELDGFRPFLGLPDLARVYTSDRLFPIFRQRILDEKRPDFAKYLQMLGLASGAPTMSVLGRSGGGRLGDSIFLVRVPDVAASGATRAVFFVHGVRHTPAAVELIDALGVGDNLALKPEPTNHVNPRAVLVTTSNGAPIGWVPDLLAEYAQACLSVSPPTVTVVRVNDSDAPPNLRLLLEVTGRVPAGYRPFPQVDVHPS